MESISEPETTLARNKQALTRREVPALAFQAKEGPCRRSVSIRAEGGGLARLVRENSPMTLRADV